MAAPSAGMQHVDGFRDTLPPGQVGPAQQRSRALIEIAGSAVRLQREDVGRIAGIGKAQLAQVSHGGVAESRQSVERARPSRRSPAAGTGGATPPSGSSSKVEAVIHSAVADDRTRPSTAIRAISTWSRPTSGPRRRREPAPPAAGAPCDQRRAGERQDEHRRCPRGHGDTAPVAEEQRAVQVGEPAFHRVGIRRGHALTGGGVDHGGAWRALVEPVGGDPARGRAADLLDARIGRLDACREAGNGQARLGLRRRQRARPPGRPTALRRSSRGW